jgi:hypothetical protein
VKQCDRWDAEEYGGCGHDCAWIVSFAKYQMSKIAAIRELSYGRVDSKGRCIDQFDKLEILEAMNDLDLCWLL